jgi:tetratricopeptide (TPR) repeat protein
MTEEDLRRLAPLQEQMDQVAQQALAAGDRAAAARIYSRMRYIPSLYVTDGRIVGWSEGNAGSPQARRALDKAYELDPDNLYVWMQTYLRRLVVLPNPTTEERIAAAMTELDKLIAVNGNAVWPQHLYHQAVAHAMLGRYEKAYRLFREAAQREPKYMDWNGEIGKLEAEMKRIGVAIPAD